MSVAALASLSTVYIASGTLEGIALAGKPDKPDPPATGTAESDAADSTDKKTDKSTDDDSGTTVKLSDQARAALARLQARDRQVRAHEQAHLAAAAGLVTSGASYVYQKGPDGVSYAVGGEVTIDVSAGRDPQDTINRARIIQAAALAPADPSGQDYAVAAQARQMEQQAWTELQQQRAEQRQLELRHAYGNARPAQSGDNGGRINSFA